MFEFQFYRPMFFGFIGHMRCLVLSGMTLITVINDTNLARMTIWVLVCSQQSQPALRPQSVSSWNIFNLHCNIVHCKYVLYLSLTKGSRPQDSNWHGAILCCPSEPGCCWWRRYKVIFQSLWVLAGTYWCVSSVSELASEDTAGARAGSWVEPEPELVIHCHTLPHYPLSLSLPHSFQLVT